VPEAHSVLIAAVLIVAVPVVAIRVTTILIVAIAPTVFRDAVRVTPSRGRR